MLSNLHCYKCGRSGHKAVTCKNKKEFSTTIECYDCHNQVVDLKEHRKVCINSKKNKSIVNVLSPVKLSSVKPVVKEDTTDFYFLLDVSSSMSGKRLIDSKATLLGLFDTMNESDRIGIVTFDTNAYFKLKPRPVGQIRRQNEMPETVERIFAKGMTAIWDAIYITVDQIRDKDTKTLIITLTDGDDNSSKKNCADVEKLIAQYPNVSLSIIHIDGNGAKNKDYAHLCEGRGEYTTIVENEIIIEVTRIFKTYYRVKV